MNTQPIPVFCGTMSSETTLLCNARDLHTFLEAGKHFASWIGERITEYGFIENQDYIIISQIREKIRRGRPAKEYHLTLDTAKELAMVERNEKGRQVRRYFIECEKKLITPPPLPRRILISIDPDGHQLAQMVPIDACVLSPEQMLAAIIDNIVTVDRQLHIEFINASIRKLCGHSNSLKN